VAVDGAKGDCEWQGAIPYAELPQVVQSAIRGDRDGKSESVSGGLSLSGERSVFSTIPGRRRFERCCMRTSNGNRKRC